MPHFQDSKGGLHYLDEGVDRHSISQFPTDAVLISDEEVATLLAPSKAHVEAVFTAAIQKRLDNFAQTRGYDSILSACTYATGTVSKFQTEGQTCVTLREATWAAAYEILAQVQAGQRPMPATIEDIEDDLPALAWPT